MRSLILLFIAIAAATASAQSPDVYKVGSVEVVVPAPAGHTNVYPKLKNVATFFDALMEPNSELLAVHVEEPVAEALKEGAPVNPFGQYTNVISMRSIRDTDISNKAFLAFEQAQRQQFPDLIDPVSAAFKNKLALAQKGLIAGGGMNLGHYDDQPEKFSVMILASRKGSARTAAMISSITYVLVRKRILYLYIYKGLHSPADAAAVAALAKSWSDAVLAANK